MPIGKRQTNDNGDFTGYVNITSVNDGKDYIENATAVSLFGRIETSESWSEVEDPSELKTLGEAYLSKCIELAVTLTVKAIDLNLLDVNYERIRLGDWVRVVSPPHNLDKWFQCTKIVYDLIDPEKTEYVFGVEYTSFTDKQVNGEKAINSSVSSINAVAAKTASTSQTVSSINQSLNTEYVKMADFETYKGEVSTTIEDLTSRIIALEGGTS